MAALSFGGVAISAAAGSHQDTAETAVSQQPAAVSQPASASDTDSDSPCHDDASCAAAEAEVEATSSDGVVCNLAHQADLLVHSPGISIPDDFLPVVKQMALEAAYGSNSSLVVDAQAAMSHFTQWYAERRSYQGDRGATTFQTAMDDLNRVLSACGPQGA